jgi:hypothetical protein
VIIYKVNPRSILFKYIPCSGDGFVCSKSLIYVNGFGLLCFLTLFLLSSKLSSIIIPNFMKSTYLFPELEVVLYSRLINNVVMVVRGFLDAK